MLLPFKESAADAQNNENWFNFFLNTFIVLNPKTNLQTVSIKCKVLFRKMLKETFKKMIEKYGDGTDAPWALIFYSHYTDMHMNTELPAQNGLSNASNPMYSYILSGIALFVLLIACINFVNLTVARSVKRAKEIGIRKVVGGTESN